MLPEVHLHIGNVLNESSACRAERGLYYDSAEQRISMTSVAENSSELHVRLMSDSVECWVSIPEFAA